MKHLPTNIEIDVSLGMLEFEKEIISRRRIIELGNLRLPVATPEDLVIMKALAQRPRDFGDIESVIDANPDIDLDRVRDWLRKFSAVLDRPDIQDEFERILKRR